MPDKYFEDQMDDEEVLYVVRKHPIVMRRGLIFGLFGPLLGELPAVIWPQLGLGWFFGGIALGIVLGYLIFLPSWIKWHFSVVVLTNKRFIQMQQKGFFSRSVNDLTLNQIQSINYSIEGIEQSLFGFGTITLQTFMGDVELHHMHHPAKIVRRIQEILRDNGVSPVSYKGKRETELNETEAQEISEDE